MAKVFPARDSACCNTYSLKLSLQVLIVTPLMVTLLFQQGAIATEVIASAPVNPVEQGGILSVRCQVKDLANNNDVTLLRTVNGEVQRLSLGEDVLSKVGDKVFVAIRHMGDGSVVYFLSIINALRTEDEGAYSCSVRETASGSEIAASSIRVNITYFPSESDPMCNILPDTVSIGTLITLNCSSEIGFPRVTVEWSRAGVENLPTGVRSDGDRLHATTTFRVKPNDDSAVFLCSITSTQFPGSTRQCHVGPINIVSDTGVVPYNSDTDKPSPTTPGINRNVDKSLIDSIPDTSPTLMTDKCSDMCPELTSTTALYWAVSTVVAFVLAILFLVIVCILVSKYYRLTNQKYPIYTAAHTQPSEKIYAELDSRRSDNKVYMTLEKSNTPMRQKYLFKSDLSDHYHMTPSRPNP